MGSRTDTIIEQDLDESGKRGVPLTDDERREIYAMTADLVSAIVDRFPSTRSWQYGSDGMGYTLAETIEGFVHSSRRVPADGTDDPIVTCEGYGAGPIESREG